MKSIFPGINKHQALLLNILLALEKENQKILIVSPNHNRVKETFEEISAAINKLGLKSRVLSEYINPHKIVFHNGSEICFEVPPRVKEPVLPKIIYWDEEANFTEEQFKKIGVVNESR